MINIEYLALGIVNWCHSIKLMASPSINVLILKKKFKVAICAQFWRLNIFFQKFMSLFTIYVDHDHGFQASSKNKGAKRK